ncbi:type II secretion system secretin GspD [Jannaschia aquimarina]|uniref:GspD protein n=1 Tax=Jannaschia aquimarina TaxID=935700 RepID=A0A0D1EDV4_9RHOB|nr:type II secretion system secretin GspD [Jannaschia aquimarina]KIT15859.1 putative type II secretion system protein D precursor [Jannaschia aquimarina]SNT10211.1 type II secretion system protein D (GspD) [Jannaschia aquimarina]
MNKLIAGAALIALLSGCNALVQRDDPSRDGLESWRAKTILGGGDGQSSRRSEGRVVSGRMVEAGNGTIYPGRQPLFRSSDMRDSSGQRTVSLNLVDVSISDAAAAILGELLNINYVLDPAVQGTVNIRSTEPISRTTAIEVFELALKQNNAALVRRGDTFAIVPLSSDLSIGASVGRDVPIGYSLRVIPLRNIGAQEMATILQPFAGSGIVGIDAQRNIVVLAGTSGDQRAWQDVIQSFDVDWLANKSVGIFPIRGRSAQSIVEGLNLIVETEAGFEPLVVFETIPENNSILAVAKTPSALKNVSTWIQRLTREGANDAQVYSYDMKYARASDIAPTLASILGAGVEADVVNAASEEDLMVEAGLVADPNATRIVASEGTNTLLVHATHSEYQRILGMLHRLDVPPRQVLVEATIVEVSLTDELRYGTQYFFEDGNDQFALSRNGGAPSATPPPGFSAAFNVPGPEIVVDALDEVTDVKVVSSPNLMILNNESARLAVGDQIPISVRTAADADENDDETIFVSDVEFRDTGVIFEVTPRINSSGAVILDIEQEVSTVAGTDASTGNPIISQRTFSSSVAIDSGETIALGGLFEDRKTRGSAGIPVLNRAPIVGGLFGNKNRRNQQTELLVLITPRIVNSKMDARRVTSSLRDRMQRIRLDDATLSTNVGVPSIGGSGSLADEITSIENTAAPATRSAIQPAAIETRPIEPAATGPATHLTYLGMFGSERAAKRHWARLSRDHDDVLGGLQPRLTTERGRVELVVGPFTAARANGICGKVRSDCYTQMVN